MLRVADRDPAWHLKMFLETLLGNKSIKDALSKLDRLTEEEVKMATVQILKVTHRIESGVNEMQARAEEERR